MLYKPKNMIPSTNTPYSVVDPFNINGAIFSCILTGTTSISKYRITIRLVDNDTWFYVQEKTLDSPFYPINYDNTINVFEAVVQLNGNVSAEIKPYRWTIEFWETGNESETPNVISSEEVFYVNSMPTLTIDEFNSIKAQEYEFSATYTQDQGVDIQWFGWKLTNDTTKEVLVNTYDKNHIYGTKDNIKMKYSGFLSDNKYKLELKVCDEHERIITAETESFNVSYGTTLMQSEFTSQPLRDEHGVLINFGKVSVICGRADNFESDEYYTDLPAIDGEKNALAIPLGKTIIFSDEISNGFGIPSSKDIIWEGQITPDLFTNKSKDIEIIHITDENDTTEKNLVFGYTFNTQNNRFDKVAFKYQVINKIEPKQSYGAYIDITDSPPGNAMWYSVKMSNDGYLTVNTYCREGALYPSETLYPSNETYPSFGSGWTQNEHYEATPTYDPMCDMNKLNKATKNYNKLILGGEQTVGLLYIGDASQIDLTIDNDIVWDDTTVMLAKFDGTLIAGNVELGDSIVGSKLYRKKLGSTKMEFVKTIGEDETFIVDYMVKNNSEYMYYLFPYTSDATLLPIESNSVKIDHNDWSLMVVDETDIKNQYTLSKLFKFGLNLKTGGMSTNNDVNILSNFTPYPKIQKGNSNYWSGSLTSLIGFVHCTDGYIQTPNMIQELKALMVDGRKKFLRDFEGHLFEVEIVDSLDIENEDNVQQQPKTMTIKWAEVGDAEGVSVVNPDKTAVWLLTNTGTPLSYETYIWDDNAVWDDDKYWTESIFPDNETTALGRTIVGGE